MSAYRETMGQVLQRMYDNKQLQIQERELSGTELKRREEIAKELPDEEFKDRYGSRWKEVKLATATKQAKSESVEEEKLEKMDEAAGFSAGMISKLKKSYDGLKTINPTSPTAKKLFGVLDKMNKEQLIQIVKADINFLSLLAANRLIKDHNMSGAEINKVKKEEVDLDEEWTIEMPPAEGGKTVTGLDSKKVMSFIKSKGGSNRDMQSIKKGKSVTFQGKTGGFYKVIKEGVEVSEGRQLKDPKKEMMVSKGGDVKVIDKKDWPKYEKKGYVQAEETEIKEGTWAFPSNSRDIKKAKDFMRKPQPLGKEGDDASSALYSIFGDDELHDELYKAGKENPKRDARDIVKQWLKDMVRKDYRDPKDAKNVKDVAKQLGIKEEVELDEKAKYDIYHKDFSSAMQHAYKAAKKMYGITVDPKEIDDKVATGPRKPSTGKTNKYRLKGDKGAIQVQVYNTGKKYELNMYKEEVELDESKQVLAHGGKGKYKVVNDGSGNIDVMFKGKSVGKGDYDRGAGSFFMSIKGEKGQKSFDDAQAIADYFAKNKITEAHEMGTDEYRKYLEDLTPHSTESARSDAMRSMRRDKSMFRGKDSADVDDVATKDDRKAASKNILQQLKKTLDTKGKTDIEFLDKKKKKVPYDIAVKAVKKYMGFRSSTDKLKFQQALAKSYKSMLQAVKEDYVVPKTHSESILDRIDTKLKEKKNG